MELNREKCMEELDFKIRYSKFVNSEGVLLSTACAQFCLEHAQLYEQKIKELTEENERLKATRYVLKADGSVEMIPTVKSVRADTVREMQERLKAEGIHHKNFGNLVQFEDIDQIAKEMLEAADEV